jgi:hypothetical protein
LGAASPQGVATAAAAAADGGGGSPGRGVGACRSPPAAAAAAAAAAVEAAVVTHDSVRERYGLLGLAGRLGELAAAVDAAAAAGQQPQDAAAAAGLQPQDAVGAMQQQQQLVTQPGSSDGSSGSNRPGLAGQCLDLARSAAAAAEALGRDLAHQSAAVVALQGQLDRSMERLEQQVGVLTPGGGNMRGGGVH